MIHFLVSNQKLKMQCNFIMNRSTASGRHSTPKIARTRLTKIQKGLMHIYVCIYIYIYIYISIHTHTHTYIYIYSFLPLTLFPILGPYIPLSLGFLTLFLSVSTTLIFSDSVYASSGSLFVTYSVSLSPFPSLSAS